MDALMGEGDVRVRPFCLQDADAVARLWHASWATTGVAAAGRTTAPDLRRRIDRELAAGWEVFLAERVGAVAGFLALRRTERCLDQLFVAPDAKRRGIGSILFRVAQALMPTGFWLRTAADGIEARAFYEAAGMTFDRFEPHPTHGHDTAVYVIGSRGVDPCAIPSPHRARG